MAALNIEHCPETGICSIVKGDGKKIDLMPDEAAKLGKAGGDTAAVKKILADVDVGFADSLDAEELAQISADTK